MASISGINIAGLVLTGGFDIKPDVEKLCEKAIESGLPIMKVETDSFRTALLLRDLNAQVPFDDVERLEQVKNGIAEHIDVSWIKPLIEAGHELHLRPVLGAIPFVERTELDQLEV